jgi:ribosomal-protein-alanine N-acetyltransferase
MNQFDLPLNLTTVTGFQLSLRLLTEEDLGSVMELEKSAHSHPWRLSSFEDCLKGRQRCWLAESKDKLVAIAVVI